MTILLTARKPGDCDTSEVKLKSISLRCQDLFIIGLGSIASYYYVLFPV